MLDIRNGEQTAGTTMFQLKLLESLVLVLCFTIYEVSSSDASVPLSSKSSLVEIKANQDGDHGAHSNTLDIHLAMESGNNPSELQSFIQDEVNSQLKGLTSGKGQQQNPLVVGSTTYNEGTGNSIEAILLERTKSFGVQYISSKNAFNRANYPQNCKEIQQNGNNVSGVYEIYPKYAKAPFPVLCDMETMGGGWTHIQKRFDGSQDFFREWRDYKFGFGNLEGEFWLGLENLYVLTAFELSELLVEVVDRDNVSAHAHYNSFAIGSEPGAYKLEKLAGFTGDAGDSLTHHLGAKFSTKDFDVTTNNCATLYPGGWWYKECHISNLNGKYINVDLPDKYKYKGLHWKTFRTHEYCHGKSRILVRPAK